MNVLVPLLEGRQKRNLLRNGTIIDIVGESVNFLQDGFFRAHALSVSLGIFDASPAFRPLRPTIVLTPESRRPLHSPGWRPWMPCSVAGWPRPSKLPSAAFARAPTPCA